MIVKTLSKIIMLVFTLVITIGSLAGSIWLARFIYRVFHITRELASVRCLLIDFVVFTSLIGGCYHLRDKRLDQRNLGNNNQ